MTAILLQGYVLLVNAAAFLLFGVDKWKAAHKKWRIQERVLLGTALLGGAEGALLAMVLFEHKTHKPRFRFGVPAMLVLHAAVFVFLKWAGIV